MCASDIRTTGLVPCRLSVLLYESLHELGLATRPVSLAADDGLELRHTRIVNAVKCLPPENKPRPDEIRRCNAYLRAEVMRLHTVRVYVALGRIAHDALLLALSLKRSAHPFAHGREHPLESGRVLIDSYHCSRYNTQTGRLTPKMFRTVLARARDLARLP
jgi:uracil-DNA glycosylase